jgi:hypothetical protein
MPPDAPQINPTTKTNRLSGGSTAQFLQHLTLSALIQII